MRIDVASSIAFVAGATGYTGREVVRVLCERGVATTAHVRPDSSRLDEWRQRFTNQGATIDTTPWEETALADTLARIRPTHVFSLLGTTKAREQQAGRAGGATEGYQSVDYGLTRMLIDAAVRCGSAPRFLYLSSAGADGRTSNAYLRARLKTEQALHASGLPYTIARPSFITGSDRDEQRPGERFAARLADAVLAVAGFLGAKEMRKRYRSTTNTVLARGIINLTMDPDFAYTVVESEGLRG